MLDDTHDGPSFSFTWGKAWLVLVLLTSLILGTIWWLEIRSPTATDTASLVGYLHAQGKLIVDGRGKPVILRGMGFGGWMVQEPYIMLVGKSATKGQHSIFANVKEVIGDNNLETYHQAWLDNYCTRADVMELARSGFNSLRVPLHYNLFTLPVQDEPVRGQDTWLPDGFARLDQLLEWCRDAGIYLILDLHAAPGGQGNDSNISDYDRKFEVRPSKSPYCSY
jgi:aryl-phospho-beta-D-glucosidase BglC (GH1 family)